MEVEIKVVSKEIITPSSPTPNDVSNYKLSFIDQMSPPIHIPYTLFYKAGVSLTNSEISSRLKKSLSKTLSLYYPLAGRIVDNTYVNCNDQGITYIEAEANCKLLDVINEPIPNELDKLNPHNLDDDVNTNACIIVQTTFFNCGGLAIGVGISHKLCDGWSFSLFANSWAAISRGGDVNDDIQSPIFNGAKLFPSRSDFCESDSRSRMTNKEDIITKRFIFTASKINDLRDKYTNTTRAPTRIEALSAFIWTRFMVSTTQTKDDLKKISILLHIVNIRKRVVPSLPDESFGNFIRPAIAVVSLGGDDEEEDVSGVVQKLRESIRGVGGSDYVNSINSNTEKPPSSGGEEDVVPFLFTSLCRFPLYEADFGWGKPIWIGFGSSNHKNVVGFIDSPDEGCIEAWVSLKLEDMAMFKADQEVLAYGTT